MASDYDSYDYLAYWKDRSYEDKSERIALETFFRKIPQKESLLDVGGGFGRLWPAYRPFYQKAVVVDPSEKNLQTGKKLFGSPKNLDFSLGSLPSLEFRDAEFSTVLMIRVSHHLPELRPSFKEIHRLLKKDGFFILELANKNHFRAVVRAFFRADFGYLKSESPVEKRSQESIRQGKIAFVNHSPQKTKKDLTDAGFRVIEVLSVSNFRHPKIKNILPENLLLKLEKWLQKPLAKIFFGPSIFFLCQKE